MPKAPFLVSTLLFMSLLFLLFPHQVAEAGMWSNIKGIFSAPEKIDALEQQYIDAKQQLDAQKEQLTESLQNAEQYAARQEELMQQNDVPQNQ